MFNLIAIFFPIIIRRKTVLVKPTPTVQTSVRTIPQAAIGVNRRYKIIIVKNKSGKILEKRRVYEFDF